MCGSLFPLSKIHTVLKGNEKNKLITSNGVKLGKLPKFNAVMSKYTWEQLKGLPLTKDGKFLVSIMPKLIKIHQIFQKCADSDT